jgi:hypothetical protein
METVLDNNLPIGGKPKWLKVKLPIGQKYTELRGLVDKYKPPKGSGINLKTGEFETP